MSFFAYYMGPPQVSFFAYYVGAPLHKLLCILYGGPLRSVSLLTIGGPLRSVSSHTKWGPSVQFLCLIFSIFKKNVRVKLSLGGPHIFEFPGGGGKGPLLPPPAGAHVYDRYVFSTLYWKI